MKVVLVHRKNWPYKGPSSSFSTFNAHALARNGVETHLLVGEGSTEPVEKVIKEYYGLIAHPNLHIHRIPKFAVGPLSSSKPFYWQAYRKAVQLIKGGPTDAISTRDPGFLPYLLKVRKKTGTKAYYETHNYFMEINREATQKGDLTAKTKYHKLEKTYVPQLDGLFCLLSPQAELYAQHIPTTRIHVAHPGVPSYKKPDQHLFSHQRIAYIGSLQEQRDFQTLFKAISLMKHTPAKFMIIGGRPNEMDYVNALIDEAGIRDKTEITGWVSYTKLESLLNTVSLGVVPMKDSLYNRALTAPMKIFDYLSRGIPVVAADLPSAREFLRNGKDGVFYPAGNAIKLAEVLDQVLTDEQAWSTYSQNAAERADSLTWDRRARQLIEVFS